MRVGAAVVETLVVVVRVAVRAVDDVGVPVLRLGVHPVPAGGELDIQLEL